MKAFDKIFFGLILGAVFPVMLFLAGWWGTFKIVPENQIFIYAFSGLALGIIIDFFFLKKFVLNLYEIHISNLILVYIIYSICCFGFFMGVPVFNVLLGFPAGYYAAKRCLYFRRGTEFSEHFFHLTARFTSIIMLFISIASAAIALSDPFTATNLRGMFGLNFEITRTFLFLIIAFGGVLLIAVQYFLTKYTAIITYNRLYKK